MVRGRGRIEFVFGGRRGDDARGLELLAEQLGRAELVRVECEWGGRGLGLDGASIGCGGAGVCGDELVAVEVEVEGVEVVQVELVRAGNAVFREVLVGYVRGGVEARVERLVGQLEGVIAAAAGVVGQAADVLLLDEVQVLDRDRRLPRDQCLLWRRVRPAPELEALELVRKEVPFDGRLTLEEARG